VAVVLAVSAIPFSAAALPQSPILFNKEKKDVRKDLPHFRKSFEYPTDVTLEVGREIKSRRGGQPPTEFHELAKIKAVIKGPQPKLTLEGKQYDFFQLHFHRTAEHLENQNLANLYGMELHVVHTRPKPDKMCGGEADLKAGNCEVAVVGHWLNVAVDPNNPNFSHNAEFEKLFNAFAAFGPFVGDPMNPNKDTQKHEAKNFNMVSALLPSGPGAYEHYRYHGSLTTTDKQVRPGSTVLLWNNMAGPPVEGANETWQSDTAVEWVMFQKPITISKNQLGQYSALIGPANNHFGAQYGRPPFNHLFGVWKPEAGHDLKFIAVPEPSSAWLLAVAAVAATVRMRCRGKRP
jgi:carbonic anhydrase